MKESGSGSFIFTDLDNFKTVNDTLGHQTGDKVLQEMAAKLQQFFRSDDIIGRFGGDEFYIYAPGFRRRRQSKGRRIYAVSCILPMMALLFLPALAFAISLSMAGILTSWCIWLMWPRML